MEPRTYDEIFNSESQSIQIPNQDKIKTNPFFFRCEEKEKYCISSIEDFLVTVKREEIPLGTLLRGNYSTFQKRRIIKRSIKDWIYDFESQKSTMEELVQANKGEKPITMKKIKIGTYFGLCLCTIIVFMLAYGNGVLFTSTEDSFFYNLMRGFKDSATDTIGHYALVIGVYSSVAAWAMISAYRVVLKNFFRLTKNKERKENEMRTKICTDFYKKSKKTYKYYVKASRKSNLSDLKKLPIEETGIIGYTFEDIQSLDNDYKRSTLSIKKRKNVLQAFRFISLWLTRLAVVFVIGYSIVVAVINLFKGA